MANHFSGKGRRVFSGELDLERDALARIGEGGPRARAAALDDHGPMHELSGLSTLGHGGPLGRSPASHSSPGGIAARISADADAVSGAIAAGPLSAGTGIAIVSYATDAVGGTDDDDILRFVLLGGITAGTQIFFSDRAWNGTAFAAAGGGDGTFTYTAEANLPAGTVVTITSAQLFAAGMNLSDAGDTIYAYRGTDANTPTSFLYAIDLADGNGVFNGLLTNTGLTVGFDAVAVSFDQASYAGPSTQIAATQLASISTTARWHGTDGNDILGTMYDDRSIVDFSGPLTNPDMQLFVVNNGGGQSDAIVRVDNDEAANIGTNLTRLFRDNPAITRLEDITFDIEDGVWFAADNEGTDITRILKGNIADLFSGTSTPTITVVYDYPNNGADSGDDKFIQGIEIDTVNNRVYFTEGELGFGHNLKSMDYNGGTIRDWGLIDLVIDPTFGFAGGIEDFVIDPLHNTAYFSYVLVNAGAGQVLHNYVVKLTAPLNAAAPNPGVENYAIVNIANAGAPPPGYPAGRIPDAEGSIRGMDYDAATNTLWFVTGRLGAGGTGGIFTLNLTTNVYTEIWQQPSNNAHNTPQGFPTTLLVDIEVDSIGGRYYVTSLNSTDTPIGHDGTATDENGSRIWSGSLTAAIGTAPTFFASVFENTANGAGAGMEIDYAPTLAVTGAGSTYTESTNLPNSPAGPTVDVATGPTVNDVDQAIIKGATVAITTGFFTGDSLTFTNSGGITGSYDAVTGVLTFTGNATFAQYQTVLDSVRFTNAGDNPTNYGANPTRTISFTVFDGLINSDPATAVVTVTGINDAPVNTIQAAALGISEDATNVVLSTSGNAISVFDADANPATQNITVTLSVTQGALTILTNVAGGIVAGDITGGANGSGTITITATQNRINATLAALNGLLYNPIADYNGVDTLTIITNDQGFNGNDPGLTGTPTSEQDSDTRTINIAPVVDIVNDGGATSEDAAVNVMVLANDSFENVEAITGVTQGANGTVAIHDNGTVGNTTDDYLVYTANADFNGTDSFQYTVTSGGVTEQATVNVTISAVVDIANDGATTNEDTAVNVLVFANDSFEASNEAITAFGQGTSGSVALHDNGTAGDTTDDYLVYTPNSDFNGIDSFTYTVTSGGVTEQATVNVTITAVDDAIDDNYSVIEDSGANTLDLLGNDGFESTDRFISAVTQGLHGSVAIHDNGTAGDATDDYVVYTVTDPDFSGSDSFTYSVTSGGVTEDATVNVSIQAANDAPTSTNISGDTIVWAEGDSPQTLDLGTNATLADIDSADFDTGTLTVSISGGLVAAEDELSVEDDANVTVTGSTVAVGGVDIATFTGGGAGGGDLVFTFDSDATPARVALLMGAICYSNSGGDNPTDGDRTVTWTLVDGDGVVNAGADTLSFTTTVDVDPIDDGPEARDDSFTTDEATAIVGGDLFADNGSGVDSDPDGPALAITEVNGSVANVGVQITLASGALLTVNSDGSFDYDPNGAFDATPDPASGASNASPTDSFTYTVGGVSTATVTITVNGLDSRDFALGTAGADSIDAGLLGDWIVGLQGSDTLFGNTGSDTLVGGSGGDSLIGGGGSDWAGYRMAGAAITADLAAGTISSVSTGADTVTGIENVIGTGNADSIAGDGLDNELWGRDGDDTLAGRAGRDTLRGGTGGDRFDLAGLDDADADKIVDFEAGTDLLGLNGAAYGLAPGALDPNVFVIGDKALDADDRVIYDAAEGKLYFDADGLGGASKILIAKLIDLPTLSASDFVVI